MDLLRPFAGLRRMTFRFTQARIDPPLSRWGYISFCAKKGIVMFSGMVSIGAEWTVQLSRRLSNLLGGV